MFGFNNFLNEIPPTILTLASAFLGAFAKEIFLFVKGKTKEKIELEKTSTETGSLTLKDNLVVTRYNKEEYEDLMSKYEALEAKYKQAMKLLTECEREMNEWKRRYNVFKSLRNEE